MDKEKRSLLIAAAKEGRFDEVGKILGMPLDPRKPWAAVLEAVADVDTTGVGEDLFAYDVDEDVKEVYVLANNGASINSVQVVPSAPNTVAFNDISSREYRVHLFDLYRAKYSVLGKKKKAATRSLDAKEIKYVLDLGLASVPVGNQLTGVADEKFKFPDIVDLVEKIEDYADDMILVVGSSINRDLITMDYDENKYHSLKSALADLGIAKIKVTGKVKTDGGGDEALMDSMKCLLVGRSAVNGRPIKVSRRELPEDFEGIKMEKDALKQRATILSPAVMNVGTDRKPSVALWGVESLAVVCTNTKALASFEKTVTP